MFHAHVKSVHTIKVQSTEICIGGKIYARRQAGRNTRVRANLYGNCVRIRKLSIAVGFLFSIIFQIHGVSLNPRYNYEITIATI